MYLVFHKSKAAQDNGVRPIDKCLFADFLGAMNTAGPANGVAGARPEAEVISQFRIATLWWVTSSLAGVTADRR
jgi:hypothetical protein